MSIYTFAESVNIEETTFHVDRECSRVIPIDSAPMVEPLQHRQGIGRAIPIDSAPMVEISSLKKV